MHKHMLIEQIHMSPKVAKNNKYMYHLYVFEFQAMERIRLFLKIVTLDL